MELYLEFSPEFSIELRSVFLMFMVIVPDAPPAPVLMKLPPVLMKFPFFGIYGILSALNPLLPLRWLFPMFSLSIWAMFFLSSKSGSVRVTILFTS
jgi:hypothetical protein